MAKPRGRGVRTDPDIADAARRLALSSDGKDWTAAGIHRRLLEDHPRWKARMPGVRTIQNLVKGLITAGGDHWSFSNEADPEDGKIVLGVIGELWDVGIWPNQLTYEEAAYFVRLRRAFPDLDAVRTLSLSRAYLSAGAANNIYTFAGLDRYLAFTPWRDHAVRYIQAFGEGRIREYFGMPGDPSLTT